MCRLWQLERRQTPALYTGGGHRACRGRPSPRVESACRVFGVWLAGRVVTPSTSWSGAAAAAVVFGVFVVKRILTAHITYQYLIVGLRVRCENEIEFLHALGTLIPGTIFGTQASPGPRVSGDSSL